MTQVSKYKLRIDIEKRIYELLSTSLAKIKDKNDVNDFLDDFFSPTEKTVIAKRLAIAVLLSKGSNYQYIRQILRVTPVTISKMSLRMKHGNGAVRKIADKIALSDDNKAILQELASIFDTPTKGLPIGAFHKKVQKRNQNIKRLKKEL